MSTVVESTTPTKRKWNVDEYYRMGESGFFEGQRAQLIDGEVLRMGPQGSRHITAIAMVEAALSNLLPGSCFVRTQGPLRVNDRNEPEPDVAVLSGELGDYANHHPTTAMLVAEVSDSSLAYDRGPKANLYASAEIPEYWIINLIDNQLEVHREPSPDRTQPFGFRYRFTHELSVQDRATPLFAPGREIPVRDLLP